MRGEKGVFETLAEGPDGTAAAKRGGCPSCPKGPVEDEPERLAFAAASAAPPTAAWGRTTGSPPIGRCRSGRAEYGPRERMRRSRCSTVFPTALGWARGPSRRAGSIVRQLSGRDGCAEDFGGGRVNRWGTRRAEGANAEEHRACLEPSPASSSARSGAYSHPPV